MTDKWIEFREDLRTASDYLRMAVPLMVQREIPPTPANYALWYTHVRNANPELSRALLDRFPCAGRYDPDQADALFFEYIVRSYLPSDPRVQNLLAGILTQLDRSVSKNVEGTRDYGSSLRDAIQVFDVAIDQERIQEVLGRLLAETIALEQLNKEFQSELRQATLEVEKLKQELEESRVNALLDGLTKIPNRRAFDRAILQSLSMPDEPASLLLVDLDEFKRCNDTYGHPMGDRILEIVGGILSELQSDAVFVARYGGEEFAVIVNDGIEVAHRIAEDIRRKVAGVRIRRKGSQDMIASVTLSVGVAQARPGETHEQLIERADRALYEAKARGRDRVVLDDAPGSAGS